MTTYHETMRLPTTRHIRQWATAALLLLAAGGARGQATVFDPTVKTLRATVDGKWMAPAVMTEGKGEVMSVSFDQLSHEYHRYVYRVEHCEYDWTTSADIFESDYLEGMNDNPIDDYRKSVNTNVEYTHYSLEIPNDHCRTKMSGNYRLTISDEDSGERVAEVRFMVVEPRVSLTLRTTTNTDIDINESHQQASVSLDYGGLSVSNPDEQLRIVVRQNDCEEDERTGLRPTTVSHGGLAWEHDRRLIFEAGNEYRKFELLDTSHPTMGIERMEWDGHEYHAYTYEDTPRRNYLTDESAQGYWLVRNSDNTETDYTCDYAYVHYTLLTPRLDGKLYVDGHWATDADRRTYAMDYDEEAQCYRATILHKQGYYSYRYTMEQPDGTITPAPTEGSFFQTRNRYQAYAYYRGTGDRTWYLVGYVATEQ